MSVDLMVDSRVVLWVVLWVDWSVVLMVDWLVDE